MTRGCNHKKARLAAQVAAELNKAHPEPMSLIHKRQKNVDAGIFDPSHPKNRPSLGMTDKAATAMAEWDNSDPFAYGRMALHVKQGLVDPAEIIKEMSQRTTARRVARAREIDRAKAINTQ